MEQWEKRKKVFRFFIMFMIFMWVCTLVSKSVYASGLPQVTIENPEKRTIEHEVETEGIVKAGGELAIHVESGMRIQKIFVYPGDIIENGTQLFQIDTKDLENIIKEKELELAELNYYIEDTTKNKELLEQKKQLELARAKEDYDAAVKKSDQLIGHANTVKGEADIDLKKIIENQPHVTSQEDRDKAWEAYRAWTSKAEELQKQITETAKKVEELEKPNEDGTGKTPEQEAEIATAKETLTRLQEESATHQSQKVAEPNFSGEDSARKTWENSKEALERTIMQDEYGQKEAYLNKEDSIRSAQRAIEDISTPEEADSQIAVYELKKTKVAEKLKAYREILRQGGIVSSSLNGEITEIKVRVGERTPDEASVICANADIPYQFITSFTKEQKKYINQGDEVTLRFTNEADGKKELNAYVDYLKQSTVNAEVYEAVVTVPEGEIMIGMSGTLYKKYSGESYGCCVPVDALIRENQSSYVYIAAKRAGILGEELYAEKVFVSVKDENDKFVALEEGVLTSDAEVIISATDDYAKGSVIRYE